MSIRVPARIDRRFRGGMASTAEVDRRGLAKRLRGLVEGEVRFDVAARALYATDASNYRQPPIGVVIPKTLDDVVAAHVACSEFGAPIVSRGAGTSLSGETVNFAVVIDHSKYLRGIGDPDLAKGTVVVENGAVNEQVNEHCGKWNVIFGPDPSTHQYCTIGGNVGNNSCGIHSVQAQFYGHGPRTSDNVHSLEIVTYGGERFWVGETSDEELRADRRRRRPTGRDLRAAPGAAGPARGRDPRALPDRRVSCRGASPATTSTSCCPRRASTSRARSSAPSRPARPSSAPSCT